VSYVMNSDGTGVVRVTRNAADDTQPHWSAAGRHIVFSSNRNGKFALYQIQAP